MARQVSEFVAAEKALWSALGPRLARTPTDRRVTFPAGNEVRVQEIGDGPPVVFIHGAAVAGSSFATLAAALSAEFRCILVDRPGCGLSDPLPNGPLRTPAEFTRFADDFAPRLLDLLGLDGPPSPAPRWAAFSASGPRSPTPTG